MCVSVAEFSIVAQNVSFISFFLLLEKLYLHLYVYNTKL